MFDYFSTYTEKWVAKKNVFFGQKLIEDMCINLKIICTFSPIPTITFSPKILVANNHEIRPTTTILLH